VKSRRAILVTFNVVVLFLVLSLPLQLAAQHTRYKLIDIGTFGGPASYFTDPGIGGVSNVLNNQGMLAGKAELATPDPNNGNCPPACFITHVFRWDKGVLTDLGILPGGDDSDIGGINARGWVVGCSSTGEIDPFINAPLCHATLWRGNQPVDLGTLGGYISNAFHVDDGGQIVGASTTGISDPLSFLGESIHPFIWQNGVMQDLGTLGGPDAIPSNQCGNTRSGLVVGASFIDSVVNPETGSPTTHAFLWHDGAMEDIPTLGGTQLGPDIGGGGPCVNNRGQVAGTSTLADESIFHAFLWDRGVLTDLGTLGGSLSGMSWLNDAGDVVGLASTANDESFHAALWSRGAVKDLGTLDGDCFSFAIANNSNNQIVGTSFSCPDGSIARAVLWDEGSIIDLSTVIEGTPSLQLVAVDNINDRGEIAGRGLPPGCDDLFVCGHAYLLIPCDAAGAQGCDANAGAQPSASIATNRSTSGKPLNGKEFVSRLRAHSPQRNHVPALPLGKLR
jgi:probable HAF family extracellular repeat protein